MESATKAVKVVPLEWVETYKFEENGQTVWCAIAEGMDFTYSIWSCPSDDATAQFSSTNIHNGFFQSLDEGKAVLQADYERRIRSGIAPTDEDPTTPEAQAGSEISERLEIDIARLRLSARADLHTIAGDIREAVATIDRMAARIVELEAALRKLLQCPAIADGSHNEPAWGDAETAEAESFARATLSPTTYNAEEPR